MAAALLLGLLEATGYYARAMALGTPVGWWRAVGNTVPAWLFFAALTPLVRLGARRLRIGPGTWRHAVPLHAALGAVFAVMHLAITGLYYQLLGGAQAPFAPVLFRLVSIYFAIHYLIYWAIVGAFHAFFYFHESRSHQLRTAQLSNHLTAARLEALRNQLDPHFLFNTLNAISVLALKGRQEQVVRTIGCLSQLLRVSLDERLPQRVLLAAELHMLEHYLEIQRVRYPNRIAFECEVDPQALDVLVPSMVLQPLVENAVQHGAGNGAGRIDIRARLDDGQLELAVLDQGPGFPASATPRGTGIGLANTRARLAEMYGAGHRFECGNRGEGGAFVRIVIPAERESQDVVAARGVAG